MSTATPHRPDPVSHRSSHAALALVLMVIIWGINFPIAKSALRELTPFAFNALRFPLAAVVVLVALAGRGGVSWPAPGDRLRVLLLGLGGNVVYQLFFILGLHHSRAGTASILLASTPIMTALLSSYVGHERPDARVWLGVLATFVGIALVVTLGHDGSAQGSQTVLGSALMIGASLAWALYTVGSRPLVEKYGSILVTAWTLWGGALGLVVLGSRDVLRTDFAAVSAASWFGVVYAGALSIGLAYLIWYYGVRQIGNTRTAVFGNLVPVVALTAAWLHLGEVPRLGQVLGALVIIAGVTVTQLRGRRV